MTGDVLTGEVVTGDVMTGGAATGEMGSLEPLQPATTFLRLREDFGGPNRPNPHANGGWRASTSSGGEFGDGANPLEVGADVMIVGIEQDRVEPGRSGSADVHRHRVADVRDT